MQPPIVLLGRCARLFLAVSLISNGWVKCQPQSEATESAAKVRESYEDQVARMFDSIRQEAGLPRLAKIRHRHELEQLSAQRLHRMLTHLGGTFRHR